MADPVQEYVIKRSKVATPDYEVTLDFNEALSKYPHLREYINKISKTIGLPEWHTHLRREMREIEYPNVMYPVGDPIFIHIYRLPGESIKYVAVEPQITPEERVLLDKIQSKIVKYAVDLEDLSVNEIYEQLSRLFDRVVSIGKKSLFSDKVVLRDINQYRRLKYFLIRERLGYGKLEPLLRDPYIEDIHILGVGPVWIVHKVWEMVKTNIEFKDEIELNRYILKTSEIVERPVSESRPIVDAIMPDGSRVNFIYGKDISLKGSSFTIRKFSKKPISITQLIAWNTLSAEEAAYLWLCVEHGMNIFISGETASGKSVAGYEKTLVIFDDKIELLSFDELWKRWNEKEIKIENFVGKKTCFKIYSLEGVDKPMLILKHNSPEYLYEIEAAGGRRVTVTPDHSLFVLDGETGKIRIKKPTELKSNDYLISIRMLKLPERALSKDEIVKIIRNSKYKDKIKIRNNYLICGKSKVEIDVINSEKFAFLFGMFIARGKFDFKGIKIFGDERSLKTVESFARDLGFYVKISKLRNKVPYVFLGKLIEYLFKIFGYDEKRVPWIFWRMPNDWKKEFLKGLLRELSITTTDGIEIVVKNRDLATDLIYALSTFGIFASKYKEEIDGEIYYKIKISWYWLEELSKFELLQKEINEDMKKIIKDQNFECDVIPNILLRKCLQDIEKRLKFENMIKKAGIVDGKDVSRKSLRTILKKMDPEKRLLKSLWSLIESNLLFLKIKKIKKIKSDTKYVYDFEVPKSQSFLAGDLIVVHNTTTLNAITVFIRPDWKIYSVEDTPEVNTPHPIWQRLVTRQVGRQTDVEMYDLLKAALRSRPNYIIVGEIRGREGHVAFQAMQCIKEAQVVLGDEVRSLKDLFEDYKKVYGSKVINEKEVVEIKENLEIPAYDPSKGLTKAKVKAILKMPKEKLIKIMLEDGNVFEVTPNHKFITNFGELTANEILEASRKGVKIYIRKIKNFERKKRLNIKFKEEILKLSNPLLWYGIGRLLGRDSILVYYKKNKIHKFTWRSIITHEDEIKWLNLMNNILPNTNSVQDNIVKRKNIYKREIYLKWWFADWLIKNNFIEIPKKSSKRLQVAVKHVGYVPHEALGPFLAGLFDSSTLLRYHKEKIVFLLDFNTDNREVPLAIEQVKLFKRLEGKLPRILYVVIRYPYCYEDLVCRYKRNIEDLGIKVKLEKRDSLNNINGYVVFSADKKELSWLAENIAPYMLREDRKKIILEKVLKDNKMSNLTIKDKIIRYVEVNPNEFNNLLKKLWLNGYNISSDVIFEGVNRIIYSDDSEWVKVIKAEISGEDYTYDLLLEGAKYYIGFNGGGAVAIEDTGHPVLSTIHAGSLSQMIERLTGEPINVPITYIDNLNVTVFQRAVYINGEMERRVMSIYEIERYIPELNRVAARNVFIWDEKRDKHMFRGKYNSYILEKKIAPMLRLHNPRKIYDILEFRARILKRMVEEEIFDFYEVWEIIKRFYEYGASGLPFSV